MGVDLLTSMRVFTSVVEAGSFAAAADKLALSRAMVTRHVAQLEAHLGARLLHRTTRRLSLTEAGAEYQRRVEQILAMVQEAADVAGEHARVPSGTVRVATSVAFAHAHLRPAIAGFLERYPGIQLELALSERRADLVEEGIDVAVRVAMSIEPGLVARRLARVRTLLCAAPSYLERHGTPRTPGDLLAHNCMLYAHKDWRSEWHFRRGTELQSICIRSNLRANGGSVQVGLAVDGLGLVLEPEFLVCDALASGALVRVLPQWQTPELSLFAAYPERRHLPLKVRCFIDGLAEAFSPTPPWELWGSASAVAAKASGSGRQAAPSGGRRPA